ncbi:hypothetical protein C0Q70_14591 [Pomacea canaliculata]|uniref:Actin-modulator n=1 Tax=Pomacea canaliculata TaxID=400727 RepID=A0A2T7NSH0_POMCA|nr:hypothetical protein C0Q70_14591 [Pomacea canaliculata]
MTGLIKPKKYEWKDSNLALFGSELERNIKKASASTEEAWKGAGRKPGLQIWRIVKFKVTSWPKEEYGKFYSGDSYIVMNTYKEPGGEELQHDIHFWIGQESTQDEYGTAAYKTVELDTYLNDVPIQHREVQGFESDLFRSYFKTITRLKSDDVFILDLGNTLYQWNGNGSNKDERFKAMQYVQALDSERSGRPRTEVLEESSTEPSHEFYKALTNEDDDDDDSAFVAKDKETELYRLSDASGQMTFRKEKRGSVDKNDLDTKDVFIIDAKKSCYVWIGRGTSEGEKKNAMQYAHCYLQKTDHPLVPVSCYAEGREPHVFFQAIAVC